MSDDKPKNMTRDQALARCRQNGVVIKDKDICRGSYSLRTWAAIDCLVHYCGYRLVTPDGRAGL